MKPFIAADILLPAPQTDMGLWPALACDQFTSQPEYWQKAEALTQNAPSTLHITLPEAYLESPDVDGRIAAIHTAMADYRARVLTRGVHGFVYVERATQSGVRQGLVGAVDLEAYSYEKGSAPLVRPSENTIVERIPPRLAVRRGAPLETPHIMMLLDDAACGVVEPFAKKKAALEKLYDTELMLGGGHIAGWAVTDAADIAAVENAVAALGTQAAFDAKYPDAAGRPPLGRRRGDGNHSLATAKAHWEEIKAALPPAARQSHPARWCLVELVNVHSPALGIEPIHRAVFGVSHDGAGRRVFVVRGAARRACRGMAGAQQTFCFVDETCTGPGTAERVECLKNAPWPLAVGTLDAFLTEFLAQRPGREGGLHPRRGQCARTGAGRRGGRHPAGFRQERPVPGRCAGRRAAQEDVFHGSRRGKAILPGMPPNRAADIVNCGRTRYTVIDKGRCAVVSRGLCRMPRQFCFAWRGAGVCS